MSVLRDYPKNFWSSVDNWKSDLRMIRPIGAYNVSMGLYRYIMVLQTGEQVFHVESFVELTTRAKHYSTRCISYILPLVY